MTTENPLLSKIRIPGETFQIPSQGIFYTNGELDPSVSNGEIEIYPMTTIDEIVFNTPDKLLSGKALVEVFARCIPQVLQPMNLLAKDIDYLLVCLRMVTFGYDMDISYEHDCETAKEHTYKVSIQNIIKTTQKFDPTLIDREYQINLPNGQLVQIKPMIYGDLLKMYDLAATKKTDNVSEEQLEEMVVDMLCGVIASVDDITDSVLIHEWLKKLKLGWKKMIEQAIGNITNWGVNYDTKHVCKDCGEEISIRITANPVDFFFRQ